MMMRSQKSKRVSWAPDFNLCQVKLFSSEDCPSKVGRETHNRRRAKASRILHSTDMDSNAPLGFEGGHNLKYFKEELSCIPLIKWQRPPKVVLSNNWHVAAGEESKEAEAQTLREMRVLEAVYPRLSAIPFSPTVSLDIEEYNHDDRFTPVIPITPIEEDDTTHLQSDSATPANTSLSSQSAALPRGLLASETPKTIQGQPTSEEYAFREFPKADVNAAASTAVAAILKSNEQGNLIDTDLLIKILSNPNMIEKLLQSKSDPKAVTPSLPMSMPAPDIVSSSSRLRKENLDFLQNLVQPTMNITPPKQTASPFSFCSQEMNMILPPKQSIGNSTSLPNRTDSLVPSCSQEPNMFFPTRSAAIRNLIPSTGKVASSSSVPNCIQETNIDLPVKPAVRNLFSVNTLIPQPDPNNVLFSAKNPPFHPVKDMNYCKELIQQHGRNSNYGIHNNARSSHETQKINSLKRRKMEAKKNQKHCMFFNSSKGCRNGSNCQYKHDIDMSYKMQADRVLDAPDAKRMRLGMEITS